MARIMVFPSITQDHIKVMQIPEDFEEHEAYRCVTSLISQIQEANRDCTWEDVEEVLEENGFTTVDFVIGPELMCQ